MEKEHSLKMTELDALTSAPHMQMIKAALPYIHIPEQRFFSLIIKFSELERTIRLFDQKDGETVGICSLENDEPSSPIDMLSAMKPYGTEEEQDMIDLMINFIQGARLSQFYRETQTTEEAHAAGQENGALSFEYLKHMLPPEQQSRFETMQMLMQALRPHPQQE